MCLVATEHGLGKSGIPKDVKKQWNAEVILLGLKSKNLKVRPVPVRLAPSSQPGIKIDATGVRKQGLLMTISSQFIGRSMRDCTT